MLLRHFFCFNKEINKKISPQTMGGYDIYLMTQLLQPEVIQNTIMDKLAMKYFDNEKAW